MPDDKTTPQAPKTDAVTDTEQAAEPLAINVPNYKIDDVIQAAAE
ncbi:hypothetical protein [Streptomyces lavendulae]